MTHNTHAGDVTIQLGSAGEVVLKPSLDAAMTLSAMPGGIVKMVERCMNFEFDAIMKVVVCGIGSNSKDLPQLVYEAGLSELSPQCILFLNVLVNGGKMPSADDEAEGAEGGDPLANSSH